MKKIARLPTKTLTAFDMQRRPAAFQRQALQEPVTITSNGEPTLVVMSVAEYARLRERGERNLPPDQIREAAYPKVMKRQDAVTRIHQHRDDLAKLGIAHVSLFGSVARDTADELSDVDVIVDTADGRAPGLFALSRITAQLEEILGREIDVISRRGLNHTKRLKQRVAADMIDVF